MPSIYLAPWVWVTDERGRSMWQSPGQPSGKVDLRSNTQSGTPVTPLGMGLHIYDTPQLIPGALSLGDDPLARMRASDRDTMADMLGLSRAVLPDESLAALLRDYIRGTLADPAGVSAVKPIRMTPQGVRFSLPGFGPLLTPIPYSRNHPAWDAMLAIRWADYRRNVANGLALDTLRRWTGYDMQKYYTRQGSDLLSALVPPEYQAHEWLPPATTIGDTFVEASDTTLTSHTATGPNGGFSWSQVFGGNAITVKAADDKAYMDSGTERYFRANSDLSSDDHYAQAKLYNPTESNTEHRLQIRMDATDSDTFYWTEWRWSTDRRQIVKRIDGIDTNLATDTTAAFTGGTEITGKFEANSSDEVIATFDGGNALTVSSETSITGYVRCGLGGHPSGGDIAYFDDWEAADLAAATTTFRPRVMVF